MSTEVTKIVKDLAQVINLVNENSAADIQASLVPVRALCTNNNEKEHS